MGKHYYLKGTQGLELINLIQNAALYNAAIVRSINNVPEIEKDLSQLCKYVLFISGAKNQNADLINHAKNVKFEFEKLRDNVTKKLQLIP